MVPLGRNSPGLFAEDLGRTPLEVIDGRVLAVDVVADFGLRHRAPHLRRGPRHGNRCADRS
jgi:hypothetical protein